MSEAGDKKTALVTGGSRGLGAAMAKALGKAGFHVLIHYNSNSASAEEVAKDIESSSLVGADLSTIEGADQIYDAVKEKLGGQIDVLVNNAGIALDNPLFKATPEEFEKTINVNMRSSWYLTKRLSRFMIRKKSGRIINVSSVVGSMGNPTQSIYGMTKAALENLTKTAAFELSEYNILVNAIAPGFIESDMTESLSEEAKEAILSRIPLKRMGKPEEISEVVVFLATAGSYMTGTTVHINGGLYV